MDPTTPGPWARPIGASTEAYEPIPPEDAAVPWIDVHQHTQSLTWNDREAFGLSGARATVMIAASYYWSPYRPVSAVDRGRRSYGRAYLFPVLFGTIGVSRPMRRIPAPGDGAE